jgi:hypothetical protein
MNHRVAHLLICLYPRHWRERYGAEFQAFLEMGPGDFRSSANVAQSALCEHIFPTRGLKMTRLPRSLGSILCAYLAVVAAGLNFYETIDDSALASAMRLHVSLSTAWNVVELGSVVALLGAITMALPLVVGALRFALREKRRDILTRLLVLPAAAGILAAWVIGVSFHSGGHWAPAPWAIVGDWTASADWPSLHVRWVLGSFSTVLAIALLTGSSISLFQAIQRTRFEEMRFSVLNRLLVIHPVRFARVPGMITTAAIVAMTAGVLSWGFIANSSASAAFHGYYGPMHTTAFASWVGSVCVFGGSSVVALRTSSSLLKSARE